MGAVFSRGCCGFLFVAILVCGGLVQARDGVTVATSDGRTLAGQVDDRSDANTLWIRRTEGNIVLTTALPWVDIAYAEVDGQEIQVTEFSRTFEEHATSGPKTFLTEYEPISQEALPIQAPNFSPRIAIASIEIDARLVNLDRTVELDGFILAVSAIDITGHSVPVRGNLSARLVVERIDQHTGEVRFEERDRWSETVSQHDFLDGIAELPLRFRNTSPDFDWELCTTALLHVRLGIYGEGNFEASVPVAIHQFNPFRDELRNHQGSRFFRDEVTRNTRHDGPRFLHRGYSP